MTPPEAPGNGTASRESAPPAVSVRAPAGAPAGAPARPGPARLTTLRRRRDFLAAARRRGIVTPGMIVQARRRRPGEAEGIRVGFTCSRKIGNAVTRNRARRRLREVARRILPECGRDGWDYVLIGRREATVSRPFDALLADLAQALKKLHDPAE